MTNIRILPTALTGRVSAPPSKSEAHRALIAAALSTAPTAISLGDGCEDIEATKRCLIALGTVTEPVVKGFILKRGQGVFDEVPQMDCGESASTLRFLLPVAAALSDVSSFSGKASLARRPIQPLLAELARHGVRASATKLPLTLGGRLRSGAYRLSGQLSSQFVTGLLFALPILEGDSTLTLDAPPVSAPYIRLTLSMLERFRVRVTVNEELTSFLVAGGQRYRSPSWLTVGGDWSAAAFFLAAGALGGPVTVTGLTPNGQGDAAIIGLLRRFGAKIRVAGDAVTVERGDLTGCSMDLTGQPDLLPPLAIVAACAQGESSFTGAARLRLKESDRLRALCELINGLGGSAAETSDGLIVGGGGLRGGATDSHGDHRIAMAASLAATACKDPVLVTNANVVDKSYPAFYTEYAALGGQYHVL